MMAGALVTSVLLATTQGPLSAQPVPVSPTAPVVQPTKAAPYVVRGSEVYHYNQLVTGADAKTFSFVGRIYAKDARSVYVNGRVLPAADPATFTVVDGVAKDARHVYVADIIVPNADPATYRILNLAYARDDKRVYRTGIMLEDADPLTFTVMDDQYGGTGKDRRHVYLDAKIIPGADPATYVVLGQDYGRLGKDATHVYYQGAVLPEADPATIRDLGGYFVCDSQHVYFLGKRLPGAESRSFEIIAVRNGSRTSIIYAKDATHVYYRSDGVAMESEEATEPHVIPGADPKTFVMLDESYIGGYAKDARAVYFGREVVAGGDAKTFVALPIKEQPHRVVYGKDAGAAYFLGKKIPAADAGTFTVLPIPDDSSGQAYAKDANAVYFRGDRIAGADPETFTPASAPESDWADARDKSHFYVMGQVQDQKDPAEPQFTLECKDPDYGFNLMLPASWKGYSILHESWKVENSGESHMNAQGPTIIIRHPKWTAARPLQDIPVWIFTPKQWQDGVQEHLIAGGGVLAIGLSAQYVFGVAGRFNWGADEDTGELGRSAREARAAVDRQAVILAP